MNTIHGNSGIFDKNASTSPHIDLSPSVFGFSGGVEVPHAKNNIKINNHFKFLDEKSNNAVHFTVDNYKIIKNIHNMIFS